MELACSGNLEKYTTGLPEEFRPFDQPPEQEMLNQSPVHWRCYHV